jgi:acetyltransferase
VLNIETPEAAHDAARTILERVRKAAPDADVQGFAVQPMIVRRHAYELILGISRDPIFGPVVLFGSGGVSVEVVDDTAIGLPPLDDVLAGDLIDRTRIGRLLAGFRDRKPADRAAIADALNGLSQMIVDFPCIAGMDINPLLADADGIVALDARIEIDPAAVEQPGPNPALAIRPYPAGWDTDIGAGEHVFHIRPIKPADVALYPDFLAKVSPDDIRLRFLSPRRSFPDEMLLRLTQLDYDRDMAFVALVAGTGELAGIGRLSSDPDRTVAEYALLVRTDLQGHGLGWALLSRIVDYARAEGIGRITGMVLRENVKMLAMCREFGFTLDHDIDEPGIFQVSLDLAKAKA